MWQLYIYIYTSITISIIVTSIVLKTYILSILLPFLVRLFSRVSEKWDHFRKKIILHYIAGMSYHVLCGVNNTSERSTAANNLDIFNYIYTEIISSVAVGGDWNQAIIISGERLTNLIMHVIG